MANHNYFGNAEGSSDSRPCYTSKCVQWRTPLVVDYKETSQPTYNLRNMVPYDRNWGRSEWANADVMQHERMHAFNIVDDQHTPQQTLIARGTEYRPLPYTPDPSKISPF